MNGKLLVVPAGSLDSAIEIVPTGYIYQNEKANWDCDLEDIPHFEELPIE